MQRTAAPTLSIQDFRKAAAVIKPFVHRTPILQSRVLNETLGRTVYLKAEFLQKTGSYKVRGPLCVMSEMTARQRRAGVICASAGNHAQGVAFAGRSLNTPTTVVMAENATPAKVAATRSYGAEVIQYGKSFDDAYARSREIATERSLTYIHPFDNPTLVGGQGTLGLEVVEDVPSVDYVLVPIGGGGLISGVSMAVKSQNPRTKIIGVESTGAPAMSLSISAGKRVTLDDVTCTIDGLTVKIVGEYNFEITRRFVDDIVVVSDQSIYDAVVWIMQRCKFVVEGAAAAPVATLLSGAISLPEDATVVCILSGGNLDVSSLAKGPLN